MSDSVSDDYDSQEFESGISSDSKDVEGSNKRSQKLMAETQSVSVARFSAVRRS